LVSNKKLIVNEKPSQRKRGGFLFTLDLLTPIPLTVINEVINNKNTFEMARKTRAQRKAARQQRRAARKTVRKARQQARKDKRQARKGVLVLRPFLGVMVKQLKKRGKNYPKDPKRIKEIAAAYYVYVMKRGNTYEFSDYDFVNPENPMHPLNNQNGNFVEFDFNSAEEGSGQSAQDTAKQIEQIASSTNLILQVANQIMNFIQRIADKKAANEPLSPEEIETERTVAESKDEINADTEETETETQKEGLFSNPILLVGIVAVAFLVLRK
jgi:hypothetical protein